MLLLNRKKLLALGGILLSLLCIATLGIRHLNNRVVNQIGDFLLEYALLYDIDKRSIDPTSEVSDKVNFTGFSVIKEKIANIVNTGKPINFNVVGFPHKSPNTEKKVSSLLPDEAEQYSLEYINSLLTKITKVYPPGASLTIFTDGTVFCDAEGIDDTVVFAYEKQLKQLAAHMLQIKIITLSDLLPELSPDKMRLAVEKFSPSNSEFEQRLLHDVKLRDEITLMEKRLMLNFDYPAGHLYIKKHPIAWIAKKLVHRSMQYGNFLATFRNTQDIRLSVHYQPDVSTKIGIKLSDNSHITPWHGVLVIDPNGSKRIEHREDSLR